MKSPARGVAWWQSGFTLVESLIGTALLVIFFTALGTVLQVSAEIIGEARLRSTATRILQERMELIKNMSYIQVGTQGGIPSGTLLQEEAVMVNSLEFTLLTSVVYIDDPSDGVAPVDELPNDYKRVRLQVNLPGMYGNSLPQVLWSDVVPRGVETDVSGGTIIVKVYNALGEVVENAAVTLVAESAQPPVNVTTYTDATGSVFLPGSPTCDHCYRVSVTKSGMSTDRTYGTDEVAIPDNPHLTVREGEVTQASFAIDTPGSVQFKAVRSAANNYATFQGVQFVLRGSKTIGRTVLDEPVYRFGQNFITGLGGVITVNNLEWDSYSVSIPLGSSVDFAGSWPFSPFPVVPGSSQTFTMVVIPATAHTLLVQMEDNAGSPVASASVTLRNDVVSFMATKSSALWPLPDVSQVFFESLPETLTPYTITVDALGYLGMTDVATVSGDTKEAYRLAPEGE